MRGDRVIVRAYANRPILLRVWDWDSSHVCVCDEEVCAKLVEGASERMPVAFGRADVFRYDQEALEKVERVYTEDPSVWQQLQRWNDNEN